jgi:hypothetical protein
VVKRGLIVPHSYTRLRQRSGDNVFGIREAEPLLGVGVRGRLELSRLVRLGWLFRVGRGRYATADPLVRLTPEAEAGIAPYREKEWFPVLHRSIGGILRVYEGRLLGIVLFGSAARGTEKPSSDIDLLVVASRVPDDPEASIVETMTAEKSAEILATDGPKSAPAYLPSLLDAGPTAFRTPGRAMLGVVSDGKILYDPEGRVAKGFAGLRRQFRSSGVRTHRTEEGRPYWSVGTLFDREASA